MPVSFEETFAGPDLDLSVWTPAYLPAWSSRAAAAATYALADDGLHLTIPDDHPVWCPDLLLILAVFEFPDRAVPGRPDPVPELVVRRVSAGQ